MAIFINSIIWIQTDIFARWRFKTNLAKMFTIHFHIQLMSSIHWNSTTTATLIAYTCKSNRMLVCMGVCLCAMHHTRHMFKLTSSTQATLFIFFHWTKTSIFQNGILMHQNIDLCGLNSNWLAIWCFCLLTRLYSSWNGRYSVELVVMLVESRPDCGKSLSESLKESRRLLLTNG